MAIDPTQCERLKKVVNHIIYRGRELSQQDIATKLGYNSTYFNKVVNAKINVSKKLVINLCNYYPEYNNCYILYNIEPMIHNEW